MLRRVMTFALVSILAICILAPGPTLGKEYKVEGLEYEPFFLDGDKGDEFCFVLNASSYPVTLTVMDFQDYYDWIYFKGDFPYVTYWLREDVVEGVWEWEMPDNESWVLVLSYPEDVEAEYEFKVLGQTNMTTEEELEIKTIQLRVAKKEIATLSDAVNSADLDLDVVSLELEDARLELDAAKAELNITKSNPGNITGEDTSDEGVQFGSVLLGAVSVLIIFSAFALLFYLVKRRKPV